MPPRTRLRLPVCKGCGKGFVPKDRRQKYCVESCRRVYYKEHYFTQTIVDKTCPNCGTVFPTSAPKKQVYCTPECREDARIKRMDAVGASIEAERITYLGERTAAFERDGFRCTVCGRGVKDNAILDTAEEGASLVTVCTDCKAGESIRGGETHDKHKHKPVDSET